MEQIRFGYTERALLFLKDRSFGYLFEK